MNIFMNILTQIFMFMNFVLPKAGTKIDNIPVYISVLLSILVFIPFTFCLTVRHFRERDERSALVYYASFLLFFLLGLIIQGHFAFTANVFYSYFPYFIALSSVFLIFTAKYIEIKPSQIKFLILCSFYLLTIYGLIQKIFGDFNTLIPGITYNYSDAIKLNPHAGLEVWGKSNYVIPLHYLKLSSTYQNGNLFGVNYIMISWFAFYFLRSLRGLSGRLLYYSSILLYIVICFLTASETVYMGLFASLILFFILTIIEIKNSETNKKGLKIAALAAAPVFLLLAAVLAFSDIKIFHAMIESKLIGRNLLANERIWFFMNYMQYIAGQNGLFHFLFGCFFTNPQNTGGYEITFLYILANSGIIFTLIFVCFIFLFVKRLKFSIFNIGIFSYLAVSFIDGGFWLNPTAFSFFTLLGVSLYILQKGEKSVPV
ncbi:MAG: hypothetical protein ABSG94_01135 [Brevinematales bacterium]